MPSPAVNEKTLTCRESLKSRITEMYQTSIKQTPSSLTPEHISHFKSLMYDKFPRKVLQLNEQCASIYSRDFLRTALKDPAKADNIQDKSAISGPTIRVPTFKNATEVAKYRDLFQREYQPYVAAENETFLLPNGTIPVNATFGDIVGKLLVEVDQFLWDLNECSFTLNLLRPPFGEEKSIDSKILSSMISNIDSLYSATRSKRTALLMFFSGRGEETVELNLRPQMMDTRYFVEHSEEENVNEMSTYAILLRNNLALAHFFALKNSSRIEQILQQALKNAKYGKTDGA